LSKKSALHEGRLRIKNLKSKGYENCSREPKLILTHFSENLNFLVNVPFIETVFHILNRNLPQGSEVWPPGSFDINPFDYLKCGISRRDINRSFHKITSPRSPPLNKGLQPLPVQARGGHWHQGQFYMIKAESIPN
jgi:hypothetical protein